MDIRFLKFVPQHGEVLSQFSCSASKLPILFNHIVEKSIELPTEPSDSSWHTLCLHTLWVVAGSKPFMSFNLSEEASAPRLSSMIYAEAKRVILGSRITNKNILSVEFTDDGSEHVTLTASCLSAIGNPLRLIHGLADERRHVLHSSLVFSVDRQWLAVADTLGRVLLISVTKRRVVRMWKGYRDAELAFVDAVEYATSAGIGPVEQRTPSHGKNSRCTLCLFIHAPHRRILEVWRLTHGPRLATWDVEEPVRLITGQPYWSRSDSRWSDTSRAFLLDSKGVVYTLSVSPDLCLAGTDSEAAMGYHEHQVMQDCYACLRSLHTADPASVRSQLITLFAQFRTPSWFERTLSHVIQQLSHKPASLVDFLAECVELLDTPSATSFELADSKRTDMQRIYAICMKLHALTNLYMNFFELNKNCFSTAALSSAAEAAVAVAPDDAGTAEVESMCDLLNWDPEDAMRCLTVYGFCSTILKPNSHIQLSRPMELHSFVDCFSYSVNTNKNNNNPESTAFAVCLRFHADDSFIRLAKIGSLIFGPYLLDHQLFNDLIDCLNTDVLSADVLLLALTSFLLYWEMYQNVPTLIRRIYRIYAHLFALLCRVPRPLSESSIVSNLSEGETCQLGSLLSQIHALCLDSVHISSAYLVSLVIRSLIYTLWNAAEQHTDLALALWTCTQTEGSCLPDLEMGTFQGSANSPLLLASQHSPSTGHASPQSWQSISFDCNEKSADLPHISLSTLTAVVDCWHDTCAQMESLFFLGLLVQVPATDHLPERKVISLSRGGFPVRLGRLLRFGRAFLTELFASWLVHWQVEPDHLISFYHNLCTRPRGAISVAVPVEQQTESDELQVCTDLAVVSSANVAQALFTLVYKRLPFTLELDTVIASVCWLHYQRWLNEPTALSELKNSIDFLRSLSSAGTMIAQGLATMMWQGRLRFWYGQCVGAILSTNTGTLTNRFSVDQLKHFSVLLMNFISTYVNACEKSEVVPVISVEREWSAPVLVSQRRHLPDSSRNDWIVESNSSVGASPSTESIDTVNLSHSLIAESAVAQPAPDHQSVASWEQAIIVVAALLVFGRPTKPSGRIQSSKPNVNSHQWYYSLSDFFVPKDASVITASFNPNWVSASACGASESSLDNRRRFFISWMIERAVLTYRSALARHCDSCADSSGVSFSGESSPGHWQAHQPLDLYRQFTSAAVTLAKHWSFPKDMVLSQHVLSLFEADLDDQAELHLSQVQNPANLATRLLLIIGRRVALHCFDPASNTSDQLRWRACVPFELESWLHGLLPDPLCQQSPDVTEMPHVAATNNVTHLARLIDFVLLHIPSQASQTAMAEALRDAIYAVADDN